MRSPTRSLARGVRGLFGVMLGLSAHSVRAASPAATPTATPKPQNGCRSLPITELTRGHPELAELEGLLREFESSFETRDARRFRTLIHPAIKLDASKRDPIFEHTFLVYGLDKPKLTLSGLYELTLPNRDNPVADCITGQFRGVVGPERQYAAVHTVLSASEQIRFLTLFAAIPPALQPSTKSKFKTGVVMFHTQVWTHARKAAVGYLEDARKWSALGDAMSAWVLAEAGRRLLDSNPYFTPRELYGANQDVAEYFGRMVSREAVTEAFRKKGLEWAFEGFTTVFQAQGVEPGARFRLKKEESVEDLEKKCRLHVSEALQGVSGLRDVFRGVECIPYSPGEDGQQAPLAGTVFVPWKSLAAH